MTIIRNYSRIAAPVLLILLGFSIPISVVSDNILLGLILLCWVMSGEWTQKWLVMWRNPVARAGFLLFVFLVLGAFYGKASFGEAGDMLFKLKGFLLIGLFAGLIPDDPRLKARMLNAFLWAMGLTLFLTYLIAYGVLQHPAILHLHGSATDAATFKDHITQNFLMSYAAFVWTHRAWESQGKWRAFWMGLVLLSVFSVFFLVQGRTGYLTLALLTLYSGFHFSRVKMKGIGIGFFLLVLAAWAAFHYSHRFENRIQVARMQTQEWQPNLPVGEHDSIGLRLEFYTNSLRIWLEHPFIGVGTGGFASAYQHRVGKIHEITTVNPHNDYLLIAVQLGVVGFVALLYLYFCTWQASFNLPEKESYLARGLMILYVSGGMVDAVMFSHTESMCFAWLAALIYSSLSRTQERTCV